MSLIQWLQQHYVSEQTQNLFAKIPRSVGSLGYDPWGYKEETSQVAFTLAKWLYEKYFRVQAFGLENIPPQGRALIIGNHSGQLPLDGVMVGMAMIMNEHGPRMPRAMMERFFPTAPLVGNLLNEVGAVVGDPLNCVKMLEREEAVVVFPEGARGSGKPWKERYHMQRFGTGFMRIAIDTHTPIIPVGIVGCEETMPSLGNIKPLADLLHIPYIPITFPIPLPSKVYLNFGKPLMFSGDPENEKDILEQVEEVKQTVQDLIHEGFKQRKEREHGKS